MKFNRLIRFLIFPISLLSFYFFSGCSSSDVVVSEYKGGKITFSEVYKAYKKNSSSQSNNFQDSLNNFKNFFNLYVNYKLKLEDARQKNFDKDPNVIKEFLDYRDQVAETYLLDRKLVKPGIEKLFEQRKYEIRASHIMLKPDTAGEEKTRERAEKILQMAKAGESFSKLAAVNSVDVYSKNKGGDIYYFTAGVVDPIFEEAAYNTKIGEIHDKVVRTRYGFHIIKTTEKIPRIPLIRAAHILIQEPYADQLPKDSITDAKKLAIALLDSIKNGADFAELAKKYSNDPGSSNYGGDLGYFERRTMVPIFDSVAFTLNVNEISDLVVTPYGYHIIKCLDKKPLPSFEEDYENLKTIYKRTRYDKDYSDFISQLIKKYDFKSNNNLLDTLATILDTLTSTKTLELKAAEEFYSKELYSFAKNKITVEDFLKKVEVSNEFSNKLLNQNNLKNAFKKISERDLILKEAENLEKIDAEFAYLMEEYKNGILVFKIQEEEIWGKVKPDSVALYEYYEKNKDKFKWEKDRVRFSEILSKSDSLIYRYYNLIKKGENFDSLAVKYTERSGFQAKAGDHGFVDIDKNPLSEAAAKLKEGEFSEPFKHVGGWSIVKLIKYDPARLKTFEEAKPEVIAAYQEETTKKLEESYNNYLTKIFSPVLFYDKLENEFKKNFRK